MRQSEGEENFHEHARPNAPLAADVDEVGETQDVLRWRHKGLESVVALVLQQQLALVDVLAVVDVERAPSEDRHERAGAEWI